MSGVFSITSRSTEIDSVQDFVNKVGRVRIDMDSSTVHCKGERYFLVLYCKM